MSNTSALNEWAVNSIWYDTASWANNISFNGYWLQNDSIITSWEWFWLRDYSDRRIDVTDIPQWDWQIVNDVFFWGRTINISWYLKSDNKIELDSLIDEFKINLSKSNKLLKWKVNEEIRQIYASVDSLTFWTKENIYIPFDITFISPNACWSKEIQQSKLLEWVSDFETISDVENLWFDSKPVFYIWFKSATNVDTITIKVDWIWCIINQSIAENDILVVNWQNWTVELNGNKIDFEWVLPIFRNWFNNTIWTVNWTFEADVNIVYPYNYI